MAREAEKEAEMTKREKIALYILLSLIFSLEITYQVLSNYYATAGEEIYREQLALDQLRRENNVLYIEILKRRSLINIAGEASREGFIPGKLVPLP